MADEALAVFMDVTGCGYEDAFHRLASCGGHLGEAVNRFFSIDAGPSGSSRSPPPSPPQDSETEDDDEDAARAPVPAARPERRARGGAGGARGRSSPSGSSPRVVSRWDSETRGGGSSRSSRRRRRGSRDGKVDVNHNRGEHNRRAREDGPARGGREAGGNRKSSRRHRRFREDVFVNTSSDAEEEVEAHNSRGRRRRLLNPIDLTSDAEKEVDGSNSNRRGRRFREDISSDDEEEVQVNNSSRRLNRNNALASDGGEKEEDGSNSRSSRFRENIFSDDDMEVDEAPPPPPPPSKTIEDLFRVPRELTYKGGFHDAKVQAARRARWLLVNVQSLDLASIAQNRDVWASDLVSQCVREHFVLWHVDTEARGDEGEEAKKVLCYYKVPHDRLPVVVVVDPVTGQAMDKLYGTDPNDFLVSVGPYTDKKPILPFVRANKSSASASAQTNQRSATTAPTSRQEQTPTVRKPAETAVAAVAGAPTGRTQQEQAPAVRKPAEPVAAAMAVAPTGQQPASEKVCMLRVRLPDGRVVAKEFGSQWGVAALFAYCRSELAAGAAAERPFRLLRFVGASREEIGKENASFESLRLNMSTVSVELG